MKHLGRLPFSAILWTCALLLIISFGTARDTRVAAFQASAQVTATLTDSLLIDNDNDTNADPGDTLRYTAEISSSGGDADNLTFNPTLPDGVSLVPNSILVSPIAFDDSAVAPQNGSVTIPALTNDTNVDEDDSTWRGNATITVTTGPQYGTYTINVDNEIVYTNTDPSQSDDSLTYTVTDVDGLTSSSATVQIDIRDAAPTVTTTSPEDGSENLSTTPSLASR